MTAQILDLMDYEGRKMGVGCDISLRRHPRIRYVEGGEKEYFYTDSSACWKGCMGSWQIKKGKVVRVVEESFSRYDPEKV